MRDDNVWREQISVTDPIHYMIVKSLYKLEAKKMFYNIDAWR